MLPQKSLEDEVGPLLELIENIDRREDELGNLRNEREEIEGRVREETQLKRNVSDLERRLQEAAKEPAPYRDPRPSLAAHLQELRERLSRVVRAKSDVARLREREAHLLDELSALRRPISRKRRNPLVWGLGAVGLALIAIGISVASFRTGSTVPTVTPVESRTEAPNEEPAPFADMILRAEPSTATFAIDDSPELSNPYISNFTRAKETHVIHIRAPGYRDRTLEVSFETDLVVDVILEKE